MTRRNGTIWAAALLTGLAFSAPGAKALDDNYFVLDDFTFGETIINFDTAADGASPLNAPTTFEEATPLTDRYASLGIHFSSARGGVGGCILHQDSDFGITPRSGTNFLAFNREAATEDNEIPREPEVITFDTPVMNASVYVAGGFVPEAFRMDAYDLGGNLIDSQSATGQDFQKLEVTAASPLITRIIISRDGPRARATVSIPTVTGSPGGTVTIPIQVDDRAKAVAAAQVRLAFGDILTIADDSQITTGALLPNGLAVADLTSAGVVGISGASGTGMDGPGSVLMIQATIRSDATAGSYPLRLTQAELSDLFGQTISTDLVDGTLTVTTAPTAVCGDFDGSGKLTIGDVIAALQFAVGLRTPTTEQQSAVCGYDLKVGFAVRLLQAVVGLSDPPLPQGGG